MTCFFVSDLHGRIDRYAKLFDAIARRKPSGVFVGGDILPHAYGSRFPHGPEFDDFVGSFLAGRLRDLRDKMGDDYPDVFMILGNDDGKSEEDACRAVAAEGLWHYIHGKRVAFGDFQVFGYAYVPPTPFTNKDWERYDVSRYVPPGSVSPEEGSRSDGLPPNVVRHATIQKDLDKLARGNTFENAIMLFHTPPFETALDRVATDGRMIDHVPLDLHVGSIAVRRFIEAHQPPLTLHGHIHESTRLTGRWRETIGATHAFNAAHDGPDLALVVFEPENPDNAKRELL
jgi:Icc-related predicted phosphoesterase